ncbi:MAG: peptidase S41 [Paludibacteraceae bacterium]|nr:peptidase S41 [Paludibacteraceae bacterium]
MRVENDILIPELARLLNEEKEVRFTPSGNSMRPFIEGEKDSVVLAPLNKPPRKGDILLARVHIADRMTYVLHRVLRMEENEQETIFVLQGDGNLQGEEKCVKEDIIGIVKRIEYPSGKRKICSSAFLWQCLLPIRKYLLKIYRHTWLKWCY